MQRCLRLLLVALIFCTALSERIGLVLAKEKRGWTLNSAGYLLGPRRIDHLIQIKDQSGRSREELVSQYGVDGHRIMAEKSGLAGKRDASQNLRTDPVRIGDADIIHTVVDFLSFLKLKEMGVLDNLPPSVTSEELPSP